MLLRGNGTHVPSLTSQTATLVEATRAHASSRDFTEVRSGEQRTDTMRVSGMASFMSKLKSLQEADPDRSRQVLSQVAGTVREQALAVGGRAGDRLARFADKLQAAADSGDAVVLNRPRKSPGAELGPVADKLETYAHYQDLGSDLGAEDAFFEGLSDALGRMLADATSDSTLARQPAPAEEPMMLGTSEEAPAGSEAPPPPAPAVLGTEEKPEQQIGGEMLKASGL